MESIDYCYWTTGIAIVYLLFLLSQKRYRLLLPSTIHTSIWLITCILIIFELKGIFVSEQVPNIRFQLVSKFICFLVFSSIIGFILAHTLTARLETTHTVELIESNIIDQILKKFRWIPYCCGIVGIILFVSLLSSVGDVSSFHDYRQIAIATEHVGYAAIAKRISGHITIFGAFYLFLLGYKYGQEGIKIKEFIKYALLCSAVNMSIGGRVWIVTSMLPFIITYIYSRYYSNISLAKKRNDNKKILTLLILAVSMFSIIGLLRGNETDDTNFIDKFLYLTDGSKMTNMVLTQYPPGSYNLEYGRSEFLFPFLGSPMAKKFQESIAYNIGLSVTVKSVMPYIYYDYGFWGGVVMWGVTCFLLEYICIRLKYRKSIMGILLFGQLTYLLFQAPVGHIFSVNTPVFEWFIIIFIFRRLIFANIKNIQNYI